MGGSSAGRNNKDLSLKNVLFRIVLVRKYKALVDHLPLNNR